ncbi:hemerythrin domain-containing protein [Sphaerisporangium sp. NPDC051017]|uniref:hemerythrin domain-containing protein n=1 Tax=Sphaerisporangium sp. NPDC051017 TaxID=3154636 RepID=UPI003423C78D
MVRGEVARSGPGLAAQLRVNCLTVCQGLHHHHVGEDTGIFPYVAGMRPDLAPVLERLRQEHEKVAALLEELRRAVSTPDAGPAQVLARVERLIDELEAHLDYEEEQLIPVLDAPAP